MGLRTYTRIQTGANILGVVLLVAFFAGVILK